MGLALLLSACGTITPELPALEAGDLLFQDLDCGPLCDAIEAVTEGADGKEFSHVGIAVKLPHGVYIVEAIGDRVDTMTVEAFFARGPKVFVGRVNDEAMARQAAREAVDLVGTPYDDAFLPGAEKLYCSELVALAYERANDNVPVFATPNMTFKDPGTGRFFPAWAVYYEELGLEIPEGRPGCNPGQLSREVSIVWRGF
jgi:hypothetical protein